MSPELGQFSLFAGAVALPGEFGAVVPAGGWFGSAAALWRGWGDRRLICPHGRGRGWEDGRGLPVTPSARGMRARNLAWRGDLDLRVASCCR
jgi:hypothetical protein